MVSKKQTIYMLTIVLWSINSKNMLPDPPMPCLGRLLLFRNFRMSVDLFVLNHSPTVFSPRSPFFS
jgi:hypothetical protein